VSSQAAMQKLDSQLSRNSKSNEMVLGIAWFGTAIRVAMAQQFLEPLPKIRLMVFSIAFFRFCA
jgi:hypothetical protein